MVLDGQIFRLGSRYVSIPPWTLSALAQGVFYLSFTGSGLYLILMSEPGLLLFSSGCMGRDGSWSIFFNLLPGGGRAIDIRLNLASKRGKGKMEMCVLWGERRVG